MHAAAGHPGATMASTGAVALLHHHLLFLLLLLPNSLGSPSETASSPPAIGTWGTLSSSLMQQACSNTADHTSCLHRLRIECEPPAGSTSTYHGPFSVLHAAIKLTINEAIAATEMVSRLTTMATNFREQAAIHDCMELLGYSVDELSWSLAEMRKARHQSGLFHLKGNVGAWLSAALGNQDTCLEGFEGTDGRLRHYIKGSLTQVTQFVSNVMAMYKRMTSIVPLHRRHGNETNDDFRVMSSAVTTTTITDAESSPAWMSTDEEGLVHVSPKMIQVDATVAQDGSGKYKSIMEAVNDAPNHSTRRYVIYVKKGLYEENVEVKKKKSNIMLVGDGMGVTVVSAKRNFRQGWTTFRSATFAVSGRGFIARDVTFRNTAGPRNHQAVALRVDSDHSAFFRCSIEGYQDTLYAHSLRQFYRDCNIYGTVDFIFGNANAVIQHCKIIGRKPLPHQTVIVTAQGRKNPDQTTGFSVHNSFVHASSPTYLGRPWKRYSRTVFMQCYLGQQVQPRGWVEWAGDFALSSLYYGEYRNYGPGADLSKRVRWSGYHIIRDAKTAAMFTVRHFINGLSWVPFTGATFTADLLT